MKKGVLLSVLAMVLIAGLILAGCSSGGSFTPTAAATSEARTDGIIKLKYADQNAENSWEGVNAAQPWLDRITDATGGKVQFETFYSDTLCKGTEAWNATKNGVSDLSWMFHGYWANKTTLADVISLPFMPFTSAKQASGIFWKLYEKYPTLQFQFRENHVLLTFTSEPYFLITREKQVKTIDDLKGLKIRVVAGSSLNFMRVLGATPVTMGMPDTAAALRNGEIDGMAAPWEAIVSFKLNDVVKYYTYMPLFTVYFTQAMNNIKWNSLPEDVKAQINSVCGLEGSVFWGGKMFDSAKAEGRKLIQQTGTEMIEYTIPEDEMAKWTAKARPFWESWVKEQTNSGHPEAQEILDYTLELIKTYHP